MGGTPGPARRLCALFCELPGPFACKLVPGISAAQKGVSYVHKMNFVFHKYYNICFKSAFFSSLRSLPTAQKNESFSQRMWFLETLQNPKEWIKLQSKVSKIVTTVASWVARGRCWSLLGCQMGVPSPRQQGWSGSQHNRGR